MLTPLRKFPKRMVADSVANLFRPRAPLAEPGSKATMLPQLDDRGYVVPLTWAATTPNNPDANLGDALSPIIVSALSGLPIAYHRFESQTERLACVGTIGHKFVGGTVHYWGTGFNPARGPKDAPGLYTIPPDTTVKVHALRGPASARVFQKFGIEIPAVYGDPVWFLPSLFPGASQKRYDLGVVVHISELQESRAHAPVRPNLKRYWISPTMEPQVRFFNTFVTPNSIEAIANLIDEITACKCIVSTSLHGLVIAEAYGIPCAYLHYRGKGGDVMSMMFPQTKIDYRIRDFYWGIGATQRFVYRQDRHQRTNWERVIEVVTKNWEPIEWSPDAFLEAFPLPLAFNPLSGEPFQGHSILSKIRL
ncbi:MULTISPECIES: polysaccharide pyruvyl transferase family protein [unclassified Leptolyngbya]|uniref:polysaccharide pyruvyl transferase family protein n=1 Tax=unclassified Leptolyngbya TaxID=2650499 RepID=UPI001687731F|nr:MULTISPECIES: polysaccharide pyruvyl transferase family protein [unclassified Leptolyngbya]MBD1910186.1 polysaccharide pyruvyl transferase family protein [Leptolyngbya sp. FACHB-8]MBD2153819.1 polysaccharide pyruvyl transferase family protein [Leptolyngbya sp. FACHB-16]